MHVHTLHNNFAAQNCIITIRHPDQPPFCILPMLLSYNVFFFRILLYFLCTRADLVIENSISFRSISVCLSLSLLSGSLYRARIECAFCVCLLSFDSICVVFAGACALIVQFRVILCRISRIKIHLPQPTVIPIQFISVFFFLVFFWFCFIIFYYFIFSSIGVRTIRTCILVHHHHHRCTANIQTDIEWVCIVDIH